jgi:hypothetical protein
VHHTNTTPLTFAKKTKPREEEEYKISIDDVNNAYQREITRRQIKTQNQDTWVEKYLHCCNITKKLNKNLGCSN